MRLYIFTTNWNAIIQVLRVCSKLKEVELHGYDVPAGELANLLISLGPQLLFTSLKPLSERLSRDVVDACRI